MPGVPWRVEFSKILNFFFFKNPKMPKIVPKSIQTCFERVLGQIFRKKFLPSFPWNIESPKIFEKKYFQNSKKAQKCSQKYPNVFYGDFFEKNLCPVFHGGSSLRKFSKKIKKFAKFQKCPKSFPKVSKRVLNMLWVKFFENFFAQCSMEARDFEKLQKNQKSFKIPKMPKIVAKSIQTCFEHVLGNIF